MTKKAKTKEKAILLDLGDVRIKESDRYNVEVERYETYWSPRDKKEVTSWRFQGFSANVVSALRLIDSKKLLIRLKAQSELGDVLKEVQDSEERIKRAIDGLSSDVR